VNAGVDAVYCSSDTVTLFGVKGGLLLGGTTWTQISGPSAFIQSPTALTSNVTGLAAGVYTFNIRAKCADLSRANDQVVITILGSTVAKAGSDRSFCPLSDTLRGNRPGTGETGTWTYISNGGHLAVSNLNQNNSGFSSLPSNGGITTLRWTISNANGCGSYDEVNYTNYGGVNPVSVPDSMLLTSCYSTFTGTGLSGSYSGKGFGGQSGSWQTLSGPNIPVYAVQNSDSAQITQLIQGVYYVVYTVSGPCANGTDTLKLVVPPPLGELSPSTGFNLFYCDRPKSVVLSGMPPIFAFDTCSWIQTSGPTVVTFSPSNAASTTVSGLNGMANSVYGFNYIMSNPNSGCTRSSLVTITYVDTPGLDVFPDRILNCNQDTVLLRFNDTGGRFYSYSQLSGPYNATMGNNIFSDSVSKFITIDNMQKSGTYTFKVIKTSGATQACVSTEGIVSFIVSKTPTVSNAGSSQMLLCNVDTTEVVGNVPTSGNGIWSQNYGPNQALIEDSARNISKVRQLIAGKYQFRWIINGGQACTPKQDDVSVFVSDSLPHLSNAGSDKTICFNAVFRMSGNAPRANESGVWRELYDSTAVFSDSSSNNTFLSNLDSNRTYNFAWRIYNTCGFSEDTVAIYVDSFVAPQASLAGNDRCLPDTTRSFQLDGNTPWPAKGKWVKLSGPADSIVNDTVYNTQVIPSGTGHYIYQWTISNGHCDPNSDVVLISISKPVSTANAGADFDTCSNSIQLKGISPLYGTAHWTLQTGTINGNIVQPDSARTVVNNIRQGTYVFRLTIDNKACGISQDDVKVNVADPPSTPVAQIGKVWCNASSLQLQANKITKGKGFWSLYGNNPNTPGIQQRDSSNTSVTSLQSGIYHFRWNAVSTYGICPQLYSQRQDTVVYPANAGNDFNLCGISSVQLTGTNGSAGFWRKNTGGTAKLDTTGSNSAIASQLKSAGSPYTFIYEINPSYGCPDNLDTIRVNIQDSTRRAFAGYDVTYCNQDTFFLRGNNVSPDTGSWSVGSGPNFGSFIHPDSFNTYFIQPVAGTYLLKWTSTNQACVSSDFVLIRNSDSSVTALAGSDTVICPDRLLMRANSALSSNGHWLQISGPGAAVIQSLNDPQTLVSSLGVGTYGFTWSISNGICPVTTDTVEVELNANPSTAFAGIDSSFCAFDSMNLYAGNPIVGGGKWRQLLGVPLAFNDDTLYNTLISGIGQGSSILVWTTQNGICKSTDTIRLMNDNLPSNAGANADSSYCLYVPVSISAASPLIGKGKWSLLSGPGAIILNPDSARTNVSGLSAGTYVFLWTVSSGSCAPFMDSLQIVIDSIPSLSYAGPNQALCLDTTVLAANTPVTGIGTWHFVSGMNTPIITHVNRANSSIHLLDSGKYQLAWEIAKGNCSNADTMLLAMQDPALNDQCLQPVQIDNPGGLFYGDLCGAKTFGSEPYTAAQMPCNTVFYKFRTYGFSTPKSIDINVQSMNACNNGLRISLFDSAACPGLGLQHDTTIFIQTSGSVSFDSLSPNQTYILVFDEYRSPCAKTSCNFSFQLNGTALPVDVLSFEAVPVETNQVKITWSASTDNQLLYYEIWKQDKNGLSFVSRVSQATVNGITDYEAWDRHALYFPATYYLKSVSKDGQLKTLSEKTIEQPETKELISIYPNPGSDRITIVPAFLTQNMMQISVVTDHGQSMFEPIIQRAEDGPVILDVLNWPDGMYCFIIRVGEKVMNYKVAVIH